MAVAARAKPILCTRKERFSDWERHMGRGQYQVLAKGIEQRSKGTLPQIRVGLSRNKTRIPFLLIVSEKGAEIFLLPAIFPATFGADSRPAGFRDTHETHQYSQVPGPARRPAQFLSRGE